MKLRKIYSSEYYPCEGEKRLAKAVIYRAMKDVLNYHEQSCFSEGKLTLLDIKKIIRWVYKDTEIKCSFLYWAEHATDTIDQKIELVRRCRKFMSKYIFYLDANSNDTVM